MNSPSVHILHDLPAHTVQPGQPSRAHISTKTSFSLEYLKLYAASIHAWRSWRFCPGANTACCAWHLWSEATPANSTGCCMELGLRVGGCNLCMSNQTWREKFWRGLHVAQVTVAVSSVEFWTYLTWAPWGVDELASD